MRCALLAEGRPRLPSTIARRDTVSAGRRGRAGMLHKHVDLPSAGFVLGSAYRPVRHSRTRTAWGNILSEDSGIPCKATPETVSDQQLQASSQEVSRRRESTNKSDEAFRFLVRVRFTANQQR